MRISILVLACISLACLPAGNPPAGQHILADRSLTGVYLTAPELPGIPAHLLVTGPTQILPGVSLPNSGAPPQEMKADLYAFAYDAGLPTMQGLAGATPLVRDAALISGSPALFSPTTDSRGRLILARRVDAPGSSGTVVERFDLVTGQVDELGDASPTSNSPGFLLSPGRTRILLDGAAGAKLVELDGVADLDGSSSKNGVARIGNPTFVGEDLFFQVWSAPPSTASDPPQTQEVHLARSRPGAAPEILYASEDNTYLAAAIVGDRAAQLLLATTVPGQFVDWALLDTETLSTQAVPSAVGNAGLMSTSSNGHWLLFGEVLTPPDSGSPGYCRFVLFDWTTGRHTAMDQASIGQPLFCSTEWRPGREELWIDLDGAGSNQPAKWTLVWKPSASQDTYDVTFALPRTSRLNRSHDQRQSMFTRDGRYWFSRNDQFIASIGLFGTSVGLADDPQAPPGPLTPKGEGLLDLWEMYDGPLLMGAGISVEQRQDLYIVDLGGGTSRLLASHGYVVALGRTRALALLNWDQQQAVGDLTLIDLATGAQTLLAENVSATAVDPGESASVQATDDRLLPGVRIAFLTRNRMSSPYDGLWVASLP